MASKVMFKQVKALLLDSSMLLMVFGVPLVLRFAVPGLGGPAFPAVMMAYVLLGLQSMGSDSLSTRTGLTQFPVTVRDHVAGLFLSQALYVTVTAVLAALFMALTDASQNLGDIVLKSAAIGLLLAGIITALGLWLRPQVSRIIIMVLVILVINLIITQASRDAGFFPWIGAVQALLMGAAGWTILFALALRIPPRLG